MCFYVDIAATTLDFARWLVDAARRSKLTPPPNRDNE